MAKVHELLLLENVENLGIVGDVVKVRAGYARNFLLPRSLATEPSQELIAQLAERRATAKAEVAALRAQREELIGKLVEFELTLVKTCNDQGLLYGSVTQQDITDGLAEQGYPIRPRDVRLGQTIKRIGTYDVTIKPEQDLEATIKLTVEPEGGVAALDLDDDREELEFDDEGNPIERTPAEGAAAEGEAAAPEEGTATGDETEKTSASPA